MGLVITIIVVVVIVGMVFAAVQISKQKDAMADAFGLLAGFEPSQQLVGEDGMSGIAIDERNGLLCLLRWSGKGAVSTIVPYADIVSVEIAEDGGSVAQTSRGSQIGGALVGGALFGGVGAVVGGLSGSTKATQKVKRVDLRVVVDDTSSPTISMCMMKIEVNRGGIVHKAAMDKARHWCGLIDVMIRRADQARATPVHVVDGPRTLDSSAPQASSVADELKKLSSLKADGVLTDEEFQEQKQRLLARA